MTLRRVEPANETATTRGVGESSSMQTYSGGWDARFVVADTVEKLCQTESAALAEDGCEIV